MQDVETKMFQNWDGAGQTHMQTLVHSHFAIQQCTQNVEHWHRLHYNFKYIRSLFYTLAVYGSGRDLREALSLYLYGTLKGYTKNLSQEWLSQGLRRIRNITNSKQTVLPPQPWHSVQPPYSDTRVIYCHHFIWHISFVTFCQLIISINLAPKVYCPYRTRYSGGK